MRVRILRGVYVPGGVAPVGKELELAQDLAKLLIGAGKAVAIPEPAPAGPAERVKASKPKPAPAEPAPISEEN